MLAEFVVFQYDEPVKQTCYLNLQVRTTRTLPTNIGEFVAYLSTNDGIANSFLLSNAGAGPVQIDLDSSQHEYWDVEIVDPKGVPFPKTKIQGCPKTQMERKLDENHYLLIQPR